jgi:hypothetical protein
MGLVIGLRRGLLVVEELLLDLLHFGGWVDADLLGVELIERWAIFDDGVSAGLGDGGIVDFAVSVLSVADEIDDDVGVEAVAVLCGDGGDSHDRVGIFCVNVEDRDGKTLCDVGGEA